MNSKSNILNQNWWRQLCSIVLITMLANAALHGQIPSNFNTGGRPNDNNKNNTQTRTEENILDGPDTTIYKFFYLNDILRIYPYDDTLADNRFLHIDPLMKDGHEYINLGNRGSATYPLIFRYQPNVGFHLGYDQYLPYQIVPENMRFYEQNRPLSHVTFSQQGSQQNINTHILFARNFSNGLSISLDYNRIGHLGFYRNQKVSMTNFGVGLRYKSMNERFNSFILYTRNANTEMVNGGVADINFVEQFTDNATTILNEASTRQQEQTFSWVNIYKLNKYKKSKWNLSLKNDLSYRPSYYKMADKTLDNNQDSMFYSDLLIDPRGIRRYTKVNTFNNTFSIIGGKKGGFNAEVGLSFDNFNITENLINSNRTDATLIFLGEVPIYKALSVRTEGKLGLLTNIGNFYAKGELDINLAKWANLSGGLALFRGEQNRNAQKLILNEQLINDINFEKSFGTILSAKLNIPKLKLTISANQTLINNLLIWDFKGLPTQSGSLYSHTYIGVSNRLKLGTFHLDQAYHVQVQNEENLPLPKHYSTHQLYITSILFRKVMQLSSGLDFRFIYDYKGPGYQPIFGTFHLTNTTLPFYPAANIFVMAKVSQFRINLSIENVSKYFITERNYDVINNPQFDNKFRITISWLLKD